MKINRTIYPTLRDEIDDKMITLLIGARQVGKTFLMEELRKECLQRKLSIGFFNLELPSDLLLFSKDDVELFNTLTQYDVIFIDEFYLKKNLSKLLKAIYDSPQKTKIFMSGSSSVEIHKHLKESMAGRYLSFSIFPCSQEEIKPLYQDKTFNHITRYGSLPGITLTDDENRMTMILENILKTYLEKDIKGLIKEENISSFNLLLYLLSQHQGQLSSIAELAREVKTSEGAVQKFLSIMNATFTLFSIPSYSNNMGNELKKSKKYYLYDIGIRNMILKDFRTIEERPDKGAIIESFVLLELLHRKKSNVDICFWRTKGKDAKEVDFIWVENRQPTPIEVKSNPKNNTIPSGLKSFLYKYPTTPQAFVINLSYEGQVTYRNTTIHWVTLENLSFLFEQLDELN